MNAAHRIAAILPRATFDGGDAQLDAAIAHLQKRMADEPVPVPKPPRR